MQLYSGQWITTSLVSGSAYQLVCNSMEAHDLTSSAAVAEIVGSRWMTEDKIHATYNIDFMIMNAFMACSKAKFTCQSLYGLKAYNLSEATNFHIRAFLLLIILTS